MRSGLDPQPFYSCRMSSILEHFKGGEWQIVSPAICLAYLTRVVFQSGHPESCNVTHKSQGASAWQVGCCIAKDEFS